jgi:hypothetical protein
MREDPTPHIPASQKLFAGDNFVRKSGDYASWQALQVHVLQTHDKGVDLNVAVSGVHSIDVYVQPLMCLCVQAVLDRVVLLKCAMDCSSLHFCSYPSVDLELRACMERSSCHLLFNSSSMLWSLVGVACVLLLTPTPPGTLARSAQANPSLAEKLYQQFKARKEGVSKASKEEVLAKYGNAAEKPPEDLALLGATEKYVEYDRQGRVVRGQVSASHSSSSSSSSSSLQPLQAMMSCVSSHIIDCHAAAAECTDSSSCVGSEHTSFMCCCAAVMVLCRCSL